MPALGLLGFGATGCLLFLRLLILWLFGLLERIGDGFGWFGPFVLVIIDAENHAQDENGERRGPRRMDPQQMMQNMEKELNLTAEQKTKFADVMKEQQAEMQRHQEEMKKVDDKMKKVLTDEQYQKWQQMSGRRFGMGGMRGGNRGPRPGGPRPGGQPAPQQ